MSISPPSGCLILTLLAEASSKEYPLDHDRFCLHGSDDEDSDEEDNGEDPSLSELVGTAEHVSDLVGESHKRSFWLGHCGPVFLA